MNESAMRERGRHDRPPEDPMRAPSYASQFERALRLRQRRGQDIEKLKASPTALINEEPLPERQRDHPLVGCYKSRRECHIEPDWLLIYKLVSNEIIFERTGTHGDLFE